jgi:hypothetical protein
MLHATAVTDILFFIRDDTLFTKSQNFHIYFTASIKFALIKITIFILFQQFILTPHHSWNFFQGLAIINTRIQGSYQAVSTFLSNYEVIIRSSKHNVKFYIGDCHYIYNSTAENVHDVKRHYTHYNTEQNIMY